jgi:ATP-binding cassette subfamily C protein CydD
MTAESWLKEYTVAAGAPLRLATILGLAGGALVIGQAWLMAEITDRVIFRDASLAQLSLPLGVLFIVFVLRGCAAWGRSRAGARAARRIQSKVRARLFGHLRHLGPTAVVELRAGEVTSAALEGVQSLEAYFARYLPQRAVSALVPLAVLAAIIPFDWIGGLILGATAFFVPVTMMLIGRGAEELNQRQWHWLSLLSNRLLDAVQGLTTTKLFGAVRREAAIIEEMAEEYREATMRVLKRAFLSSLMLELLSTVSIATVAVSIGLRLLDAEMAFRAGYAVLLLAPEFYAPLRRLGSDYHARMDAIAAAERLQALLARAPHPLGARGSRHPAREEPPEISFREVRYAYPDSAGDEEGSTGERARELSGPAVDGVSFHVPAGSAVALVGASGAGKSTLFRLLLGHLAPQAGVVEVDGMPLTELDFQKWQEAVTLVRQEPHLFDTTLRANIELPMNGGLRHQGTAGASSDVLERAVQAAGLDEVVARLPEGLDTWVGERGATLSGGERQRVALARAFRKDAPLVLFDEPTAHLDMASERYISDAIAALSRNRTTLTIAHRLQTVRRADQILVMHQGRVAEQGTHEELLHRGGPYSELLRHTSGDR